MNKVEQGATPKSKVQQRAGKVPKNDMFVWACRSILGVNCKAEFRFHATRKWRFDYAIPDYKIAIEIDGGVWTLGRHNRPAGYLADLEKFNAAAECGWLVLKFTPQQQYAAATFYTIKQTMRNRYSMVFGTSCKK